MTMEDDARRLAAAFGGDKAIDRLSEPPVDPEAAYVVQRAVREAIGRMIVGYKLAQTTKLAQEPLGLAEPTVSPLLEGMVVDSGTSFDDGSFHKPEIEAEIVIEIAKPLRGAVSVDDVVEAAAGVRMAIEVADTRYVDKPSMGVPSVIADMNSCGALVVGPLMPMEQLTALREAAVTATLGDGTVVQTLPDAARPDPLAVVAFLCEFINRRGELVPAGAVITTGTHTAPTRSGPGPIAATFGDLGTVTATLGAPRA